MARQGRNERCLCGSGRKAKFCCGTRPGPSEADLAKEFLAAESRTAAVVMRTLTRAQVDEMFEEVVGLPSRELSLQVPLPRVLSPELEALRTAIDDDDRDQLDAGMPPALEQLDGPLLRARLVRAVLAMRDCGNLGSELAAVAVLDLCAERSALVISGIVHALAVSTGAAATPAGLVLVSH